MSIPFDEALKAARRWWPTTPEHLRYALDVKSGDEPIDLGDFIGAYREIERFFEQLSTMTSSDDILGIGLPSTECPNKIPFESTSGYEGREARFVDCSKMSCQQCVKKLRVEFANFVIGALRKHVKLYDIGWMNYSWCSWDEFQSLKKRADLCYFNFDFREFYLMINPNSGDDLVFVVSDNFSRKDSKRVSSKSVETFILDVIGRTPVKASDIYDYTFCWLKLSSDSQVI